MFRRQVISLTTQILAEEVNLWEDSKQETEMEVLTTEKHLEIQMGLRSRSLEKPLQLGR